MSLAVVSGRMIGSADTLVISASGWTYDFTFVLYDYNTESLWFPLGDGRGRTIFNSISGQYSDLKLPHIPAIVTTWDKWVASHPDSKYFDRNSN